MELIVIGVCMMIVGICLMAAGAWARTNIESGFALQKELAEAQALLAQLQHRPPAPELTEREKTIIGLHNAGCTDEEILRHLADNGDESAIAWRDANDSQLK